MRRSSSASRRYDVVEIVTEPGVYLIAETSTTEKPSQCGYSSFLDHLGAYEGDGEDREYWLTDGEDGEELVEVAGRFCYKSFDTKMNANLTRVRKGNKDYIGNILRQRHGSVLEHASATVGFVDVTRVVTHELVRHRAGTAFSQESLRFVRVSGIKAYWPQHTFNKEVLRELYRALPDGVGKLPVDVPDAENMWAEEALEYLRHHFERAVDEAARRYQAACGALYLDHLPANFDLKKRITSALRRMLPMGMCTGIVVTANHRAWRHMIELRTAPAAEEEIRVVFCEVARIMAERYPAIYQDMRTGEVANGLPSYFF